MSSLLVLIPVALVLLGVAIYAFVWAVDHEQFEDLDSEGTRILFDDEPGTVARQDADPDEHV